MSCFPQVILDSTFFSVTNDCYLSSDFLLSCEHQHHNPTFTLCFYLQLLGRVAGANPSISIPSGLHFHAQKAGGGRELRGSLTCCLPEGRPPFYLCCFWQTCVSYILWWLPGAEMPLRPQAACSQASPSFSLEKILLRKLSFLSFFYPLYQGWGELSIFSLPQFFTYPHNTKSPVSVICAEVFTSSSPSQCSPVPDHTVDTGKADLQSAAPPLRSRAPGRGWGHMQKPGCWLQWALCVRGSCRDRATSALSWLETECPGSVLHVSWAVAAAHRSGLRGDCCLSLLQNAVSQQSYPSVMSKGWWTLQLLGHSLSGLLREPRPCDLHSSQWQLRSKSFLQR